MMAKKSADAEAALLDELLAQAGVNVTEARVRLSELGKSFSVGSGGIPDGALAGWVDYMSTHSRAFWVALGRAWEKGS